MITRRNADRTTSIAVSDATMEQARISVCVAARRLTTVTADAGVTVTHTLAGSRSTFITHHLHGASLTATFRG